MARVAPEALRQELLTTSTRELDAAWVLGAGWIQRCDAGEEKLAFQREALVFGFGYTEMTNSRLALLTSISIVQYSIVLMYLLV